MFIYMHGLPDGFACIYLCGMRGFRGLACLGVWIVRYHWWVYQVSSDGTWKNPLALSRIGGPIDCEGGVSFGRSYERASFDQD